MQQNMYCLPYEQLLVGMEQQEGLSLYEDILM